MRVSDARVDMVGKSGAMSLVSLSPSTTPLCVLSFSPFTDPWLWTEQQVCQWLLWATNEFSLVNVNLQRFGMDGQVLCNLGKERFLELAPDFVGDILWEHLEQMIKGTSVGGERVQPRVRVSKGAGGLKMPLE